MRSRHLLFVVLFLSAHDIAAAQPHEASLKPAYTKIADIDSLDVAGPVLSPNGRWIVFSGAYAEGRDRALWIMSATGGKPRPLTSGHYVDMNPTWFPSGDRLAFKSSRVAGALMTMGVNAETGIASEAAPRRLTLEVGFDPNVSPNGETIVYSTNVLLPITKTPGLLRLIPARGGAARTLDSATTLGDGFIAPHFTTDGRFIEYAAGHATKAEEIKRVAIAGGRPVLLFKGPRESALNAVAVGHVLIPLGNAVADYRPFATGSFLLQDMHGDSLVRINLPQMRRPQFQKASLDNRTMLIVTNSSPTEVMAVPLNGGVPKVVRSGLVNTSLTSIISGGRAVIQTGDGVDIIQPTGQVARHVSLGDSVQAGYVTSDGQLVYWRDGPVRGVYDIASGHSRIISRHFMIGGEPSGGIATAESEDVYVDQAGENIELRAWSPLSGTSRLLRSLHVPAHALRGFAVHGDVVAYALTEGDSTFIFVASAPLGTPHRVLAVHGQHPDGVSLSLDGGRLAFAVQMAAGGDTTHTIGFASVNGDGTLAGAPRLVRVGNPSDVRWLPGTRDVIYMQLNSATSPRPTELMRLTDEDGALPRRIPLEESRRFWDYELSSDGRWLAYSIDLPGRMAIWRVTVPGLVMKSSQH